MRRFFFSDQDRNGDVVTLSERESHHIAKVLRLMPGAEVEIFNGSGKLYKATILHCGNRVEVRIDSSIVVENELSPAIHVAQGVIKAKKMELVLQKCTELGVMSYLPFVSYRTQGNLLKQYQGKDQRWRRIVEDGCKQCKRTSIMRLESIKEYGEFVNQPNDALKLIFWENEKDKNLANYRETIEQTHSIILLFGPEGGLTEDEVAGAMENGWRTVGLGSRILRAETAVISATSIVQHYLGNM